MAVNGQPKSRYWSDLTTAEFEAIDRSRAVAVLPVAATEQHGPHLAVSVDADINRILIERTLKVLDLSLPVLALPAVEVGLSPEHAEFPGTLTLSAETLTTLLVELGQSVARSGIRKLALLNTHGGQSQILDLAAQRLRNGDDLVVACLNAYRYWDVADRFGEAEAVYGIHGGAAETSVMLFGRPNAVRMDKVARFHNRAADMAEGFEVLQPYGRTVGLGWQMQDLNLEGAAGDATAATAAHGEEMVAMAAARIAEILEDLVVLDPDAYLRRRET